MPVETGKEKHPCSSHIHQRGGTCRKPPCHKGAACIGERVLNKETSLTGQFLNCVSLCGKLNVVTCWAQSQLNPCPQTGGHCGTAPGSAERGRERIPARAADASRVTAPVFPFKTVSLGFQTLHLREPLLCPGKRDPSAASRWHQQHFSVPSPPRISPGLAKRSHCSTHVLWSPRYPARSVQMTKSTLQLHFHNPIVRGTVPILTLLHSVCKCRPEKSLRSSRWSSRRERWVRRFAVRHSCADN